MNCRTSLESVEEWYSKDITDKDDKEWMDSKVREWQTMNRPEKNNIMAAIPGQQNRPIMGRANGRHSKKKKIETEKPKTPKKPGRKPKASRKDSVKIQESVGGFKDDQTKTLEVKKVARGRKASRAKRLATQDKANYKKRKAEDTPEPSHPPVDNDEIEEAFDIKREETPSKKLITNERKAVPVKQDVDSGTKSWWEKTTGIFSGLFGGMRKIYSRE